MIRNSDGPVPYRGNMNRNATHVLSENVRRHMSLRGWGLVETQKHSGVSKTAISNLLNYKDRGDKHPTTQTIEMLAGAFKVSAWQLMCPSDALPTPGDLDRKVLAEVIRISANAIRSAGYLATDAGLADVAAAVYKKLIIRGEWDRARETATAELALLGTNLASTFRGPAGSQRGGRSGKGTTRARGKGAT